MAMNVGVQYNGGFLHDIIMLTQGYCNRGTRLNAMLKMFCRCSLSMILPKRFLVIFPPVWDAQKV